MNSGESQCLFCRVNPEHLVAEDELCYAAKDSFPATEFHTLIIPKRHAANYFDLNSSEVSAMHEMLVEMKRTIEAKDDSVTGFNIGVNADKVLLGQIEWITCIQNLCPIYPGGDTATRAGSISPVITPARRKTSTLTAICSGIISTCPDQQPSAWYAPIVSARTSTGVSGK
mgnify:CR=1 FL=1